MIRARLVLSLGALSIACGPGARLATLDARTLRAPVSGVAGESAPMRATYFPSTAPRARRRDVPLLVVEPIFFRRELLYAEAGLIPYLQSEGFPVWLVWLDASGADRAALGADSASPGARPLARAIAETVAAIARETGVRRFDFMGLSLGAEGALRALEPLTAPSSTVAIRRVVFLGGAFDFAYPHSFGSRIAGIRGRPASALCSLDGDVDCARNFRTPRATTPWLGFLPPADGDPLAPARARFPFVARLTHLPVLFVGGKVDGIAPSEAIFPLYTLWGSDEPDGRAVPKLLFLAGRENTLDREYDHFDLFAGDHAEAVWDHIVSWLRRDD